MIPRQVAASLERLAKGFPVVALTGPDALRRWQRLDGQHGPASSIIYGGDDSYERQGMRVVSWRAL